MHVEVEGVGYVADGGGVLALVFRQDEGGASVGSVDVDPEVGVLGAEGGDCGQVVDGAGAGCAEGEREVEWF